MNAWLETALRPQIMRRALRVALIVGTLVVLINYSDRVISGSLRPLDFLKMALTYCVPYIVATWAAVAAILEQRGAR